MFNIGFRVNYTVCTPFYAVDSSCTSVSQNVNYDLMYNVPNIIGVFLLVSEICSHFSEVNTKVIHYTPV